MGATIPMPKEVCCRNFINLFSYLENVQGLVAGLSGHEVVAHIIHGFVDNVEHVIQDPKKPGRVYIVQEIHLRDKNYWVSFDYYLNILFKTEQLIGGYRPLYQAGIYAGYLIMESIQPKHFQILRFLSIKILYKLTRVWARNKFSTYVHFNPISYSSSHAVIARECEPKFRKKISSVVCDWISGIFAGIATYMGSYDAKIVEKECVTRGDARCVFSIHWRHPSIFRKFCIFLHSIFDPEYVRERELDNLLLHDLVNRQDDLIKLKTAEQIEIQAKLAEADKRILEQRITGGFAHEMRNAITGAQLDIQSICHYKNEKQSALQLLHEGAVTLLKELDVFHNQYGIPKKEIAEKVIPIIKQIYAIAQDLETVVGGVQKDLDRSMEIIHQIHQYAKLAELKAGNDHIDLEDLLKEIAFKQENEFEKADIVFSMQDSGPIYVRADKLHMNSIFNNLILNAKEALVEKVAGGREIKVRLQRIHNDEEESIAVEICDNGQGIDEVTLDEIFEPFFSTKLPTGTGLGLGIVKKMVQIYGGEINVDSSVGKGSTFTVILPVTHDKRRTW